MTATERSDDRTERLGIALARAIRGEENHTPCPTDAELALLVDHRLDDDRAGEIYRHLAACPSCYQVFLAAGSLDDASVAAEPRRLLSWPRIGLAAAALLVAGLSVLLSRQPEQTRIASQEPLQPSAVPAPPPQPVDATPGHRPGEPKPAETVRPELTARVPATPPAPLSEAVRLLASGVARQDLLREVRQATAEDEPGFSSGFADTGEGIGATGRQALSLGRHLLWLRYALVQGTPDDRQRLVSIVVHDLRSIDASATAEKLSAAAEFPGTLEEVVAGIEEGVAGANRSYVTLGWWCEAVRTAAVARESDFFSSRPFTHTLQELQATAFPPAIREDLDHLSVLAHDLSTPDSFLRLRRAADAIARSR